MASNPIRKGTGKGRWRNRCGKGPLLGDDDVAGAEHAHATGHLEDASLIRCKV